MHYSDWEYVAFEVDVAVPNAPLLTVVGQPTFGRNEVTVQALSGVTSPDVVDVEYSRDAGVTWWPIRTEAGGGRVNEPGTFDPVVVYDYEAPNGTEVLYRARSLHDYSGEFAASDWTEAPGTWESPDSWLKHPTLPALNVAVNLKAYGPVTSAARQGSFQAMGASRPVVVSDTRAGATGVSVAWAHTIAARQALEAIFDTGAALLFQVPATSGEPDRWIKIGDVTVTPNIDQAIFPRREISFAWIEVDRPGDPQDTPVVSGDDLVLL
jgi:hypothetical protein